ncbi:MAG: nuclear transport factor 2 family protein [Oscillospiraceae bacterium]|nr:nuclear transport factor 2 family protein [Oscillospiraceae bacterium]
MYETLLNSEKDFFKYDKITDRAWLDSVLHDNFKEVGKSGVIFYKKDTIESLTALKADRNIDIFNFEVEEPKTDCWIVHYITKESDDRLFYRTSVWVKENNLKLIFHQATELNPVINPENNGIV